MEIKKYCFVMQPFDNGGKYDKRYSDVYMPAIQNAGLKAYRIDKDPSVRKIVDDIEDKIKNAQICLADISTDNPNVWYELGYAYASGKDVVVVCDNNRNNYPFDIQHRSIIQYKCEAPSDFNNLSIEITNKLTSYILSQRTSEDIINEPLIGTDGFQSYEMVMIALLIGEQMIDEQYIYVNILKTQMERSGYNETATSIGLKTLKRKGIIETFIEQDWNGNECVMCRLTSKGIDFVLNNVEKFKLHTTLEILQTKTSKPSIDELPF